MDDIDLADRIKRLVATEKKNISDTMMDGLLKDVEHYRNLQRTNTRAKLSRTRNRKLFQG